MTTPSGTEHDRRPEPQWVDLTTDPAQVETPPSGHEPHSSHDGHRGHGLMMIICCIPMLLIAGLLFLTGIAGSGILVAALLCTAMMAAMMFAMSGGHGHK